MNTLSSRFLVRGIVRSHLWLTCLALDGSRVFSELAGSLECELAAQLQTGHCSNSLKPTQEFPRRSSDPIARLTTDSNSPSAKVRDECSISPVPCTGQTTHPVLLYPLATIISLQKLYTVCDIKNSHHEFTVVVIGCHATTNSAIDMSHLTL